jgi:putative colanic acid biosynthesis UDP-glucose lipid carrier transferase
MRFHVQYMMWCRCLESPQLLGASVPDRIQRIRSNRASILSVSSDHLAVAIEALLDPVTLVATLWAVAVLVDGALETSYLVLSLVVFALTFPGNSRLELSTWRLLRDILLSWTVLFVLLLFFGWSTHHLGDYSVDAIEIWFVVAPLSVFAVHLLLRASMPALLALQGGRKRCVIAGMNEQGVLLARSLRDNRYTGHLLFGFFDDRATTRVEHTSEFALLGTMKDLPECVRTYRIQIIYLSLPMATQPRILQLLEELRDTTASIYFVPDIFVTDLIQGRMNSVSGVPVVAVCESPFVGVNGILKRLSDVVVALFLIVILAPVMIAVAIGVKLTSPGPALFRQRRYGLDGEEIVVFKFRSLTVTEDGDKVYTQVTKNDARVTRFGSFIRRTSLDELPQFFNVLTGGMSIVGPRPHAVAVNELYRSQIPGYMVRHKVRPGITGWAQVNGFRGGDDLESMRERVKYDLDYLRNWSLKLDLRIIIKTVLILFRDGAAY